MLGLYGAADQGIPVQSVDEMRAALARGTSGSELVVYPDTPHGFNADYRPSYRKEAAEDGWKRMLAWFKDTRRGLMRRDLRATSQDCANQASTSVWFRCIQSRAACSGLLPSRFTS